MFDWCEDVGRLQPMLEKAIALAVEGARKDEEDKAVLRVLDVGCGTSRLPAALWADGLRRVHAVDVDPDVIQQMREAHASCFGLTWGVVDVTVEGSLVKDSSKAEIFGGYDLAVDKGTLDYLLCMGAGPSAAALLNLHGALADSGLLLVISIHPRELLRPLLASGGALGFEELDAWHFGGNADLLTQESPPRDAPPQRATSAILLRRVDHRVWNAEAREAAEKYLVAALDVHFKDTVPLLTTEREEVLRQAFREASNKLSGKSLAREVASSGDDELLLPVAEAHQVMFSDLEKEEYPLDLFLSDLRADHLQDGASGGHGSLSLAEALDFLRKNQ